MIYYKPIKRIINALKLVEVNFNVVFQHYGLFNFIIFNKSLLFIFKFWSSLFYFFGIKQMFSIVFIIDRWSNKIAK